METTGKAISSLGAKTSSFLVAHPVGVAIIGGVIIGMGTYFLMNKFFSKPAETSKEEAAA